MTVTITRTSPDGSLNPDLDIATTDGLTVGDVFRREIGRNATFAVAADSISEVTVTSEIVATELIVFGVPAMINGVNYFRVQQNGGTWSNIVSDTISAGAAATITGMALGLQFRI